MAADYSAGSPIQITVLYAGPRLGKSTALHYTDIVLPLANPVEVHIGSVTAFSPRCFSVIQALYASSDMAALRPRRLFACLPLAAASLAAATVEALISGLAAGRMYRRRASHAYLLCRWSTASVATDRIAPVGWVVIARIGVFFGTCVAILAAHLPTNCRVAYLARWAADLCRAHFIGWQYLVPTRYVTAVVYDEVAGAVVYGICRYLIRGHLAAFRTCHARIYTLVIC